jgi:quercetin 2,3-dioxygenase
MNAKIEKVYRVGPPQGAPPHRNRAVIPPADFAAHSPFLMLMEDWFAPPAGFPEHPHRGQETVTFVLEGALEHRDHTGGHGVLSAGDVQFMTAGAGVLHSEMPAPGGVHSLQLWLNLPAAQKKTKARYADRRAAEAPVVSAPGVSACVYTGRLGDVEAPPLSVWPMTLIDLTLEAGAQFALPVAANERAFIYLLEGGGLIGGAGVETGNVIWARGPGELALAAETKMRALFYSAAIIDEPVVSYGPFVMNTEREIHEAIADYRAGRLAS